MTYLPTTRSRSPMAGVDDVMSAATAAARVVTDPCLGQVASLVLELHNLEQPSKPSGGATVPTAPVKGIGLCKAVTPLRTVVWVRKRPWVLPVAAAGIVGGIFLLGWATGRRERGR